MSSQVDVLTGRQGSAAVSFVFSGQHVLTAIKAATFRSLWFVIGPGLQSSRRVNFPYEICFGPPEHLPGKLVPEGWRIKCPTGYTDVTGPRFQMHEQRGATSSTELVFPGASHLRGEIEFRKLATKKLHIFG